MDQELQEAIRHLKGRVQALLSAVEARQRDRFPVGPLALQTNSRLYRELQQALNRLNRAQLQSGGPEPAIGVDQHQLRVLVRVTGLTQSALEKVIATNFPRSLATTLRGLLRRLEEGASEPYLTELYQEVGIRLQARSLDNPGAPE